MTEMQTRAPSGVESPHARTVSSIADELAVDLAVGLTPAEAEERLEAAGPNRIKEDPGPSRVQLLGRQFKDVLVLVLLGAALISGFLLGDWLEAGVIAAIVVVNAAIGFTQEAKAADAAEGLRRLSSPVAKVLRSGIEHEIPTETIVPGDVVLIETGDRIFADACDLCCDSRSASWWSW